MYPSFLLSYYLQDCYSLIDSNARAILETDEFEDLSHRVMTEIISRDSLGLRDETVLCRAIHRCRWNFIRAGPFLVSDCDEFRWGRRQCRRRGLCQSEENIRMVLSGSQYLVRYLTMSLRDFALCQSSTRLLSDEEARSVLSCLLYESGRLVQPLEDYQAVLAKKRLNKRTFSLIKKSPIKIFRQEIPKNLMREMFMFLSFVLD